MRKAGLEEVDIVLGCPNDPSVAYFFSGPNCVVVKIVLGRLSFLVPFLCKADGCPTTIGTSYDKIVKRPPPVADGWPDPKEAGFY